jgi:hypothetical protein
MPSIEPSPETLQKLIAEANDESPLGKLCVGQCADATA